eukprot:4531419-Pyramimonas_sp.AAC.1
MRTPLVTRSGASPKPMSTRPLRPSGPRRRALFLIGPFFNPARPSGKETSEAQISKANEGGEAFFVEGHRQ